MNIRLKQGNPNQDPHWVIGPDAEIELFSSKHEAQRYKAARLAAQDRDHAWDLYWKSYRSDPAAKGGPGY